MYNRSRFTGFIALSYEGDPPIEPLVHCLTLTAPNEEKLRLRSNLSTFRRHLAKLLPHHWGKSKEIYAFWVESICIDKGNVAETASQVPLMGLIYGSLIEQTICCLQRPLSLLQTRLHPERRIIPGPYLGRGGLAVPQDSRIFPIEISRKRTLASS